MESPGLADDAARLDVSAQAASVELKEESVDAGKTLEVAAESSEALLAEELVVENASRVVEENAQLLALASSNGSVESSINTGEKLLETHEKLQELDPPLELSQPSVALVDHGELISDPVEERPTLEQSSGAREDVVDGLEADKQSGPESTLRPASTQRPASLKRSASAHRRRSELLAQEEGRRPPSKEKGSDKATKVDLTTTESQSPSTVTIDRQECIQQIKAALELRERQKVLNVALQSKLAEYFRKKRTEDKSEIDRTITDSTARYATLLSSLKSLQIELSSITSTNAKIVEDHKLRVAEKSKEVFERCEEFRKYKRSIAAASEHSRTGKGIPPKILDQLELVDVRKEQEVVTVRLENIKLRNKLKRHEVELRQKEELADGLHLIDFEQLKIENQGHNEKIEERNEELLKLRKKITSIVQVLAHVKEKQQFVQMDNMTLAAELAELDAKVAELRDTLPHAKQDRENLRTDNSIQRHKNGLIGNTSLLLDYEDRVAEVESLKTAIEGLTEHHSELIKEMEKLKIAEKSARPLPQILRNKD